jgi:hypothetical protein
MGNQIIREDPNYCRKSKCCLLCKNPFLQVISTCRHHMHHYQVRSLKVCYWRLECTGSEFVLISQGGSQCISSLLFYRDSLSTWVILIPFQDHICLITWLCCLCFLLAGCNPWGEHSGFHMVRVLATCIPVAKFILSYSFTTLPFRAAACPFLSLSPG